MNKNASAPAASSSSSGAELMYALFAAADAVQRRYEEALAAVELSGPKFAALTHLVEAGRPLSLSECAEKMTCVRSNITQLMDRLQADGLVRRVEDPHDRRAVRAELTALGRQRQELGAKEAERVREEFLTTLSGADLSLFRRALELLR